MKKTNQHFLKEQNNSSKGTKEPTLENEVQLVLAKYLGMRQELFPLAPRVVRPNFTDKFKTSLGPEADSLVAQDNVYITENRQRLKEAEKQIQDAQNLATVREKAAQKVQDLRNKIERTQAQIEATEQILKANQNCVDCSN